MFGQDTTYPIRDSDVKNVFPLQLLLKWQDFPETTLGIYFENKPMGLLCKSS